MQGLKWGRGVGTRMERGCTGARMGVGLAGARIGGGTHRYQNEGGWGLSQGGHNGAGGQVYSLA